MAGSSDLAPRRLAGPIAAYALLIVASILAFLAIRHWGEECAAASVRPAPEMPDPAFHSAAGGATAADRAPFAPTKPGPGHVLVHVLLALGAVLVVGQLLGRLLRWVGQPPVIGEVVAGILLGPSLLGRLAPGASTWLFPPDAVPLLQMLGQLGVILYMFVVGLEFNPALLAGRGHAVLTISHASIVAPFLLARFWRSGFIRFWRRRGGLHGLCSVPRRRDVDHRFSRSGPDPHRSRAAAHPVGHAGPDLRRGERCHGLVLAGVRRRRGPLDRRLGTGGHRAHDRLRAAVVVLVLRPIGLGLARRGLVPQSTALRLSAALVALLLSAVVTEWIGIHAVFGAFVLGAILPHDGRLARELTARIEPLTSALLLPSFFAYSGLRTELGLLAAGENWLPCAVIVAVATLGKFGGTWVAARGLGIAGREAAALGILMNTRGLMELIVLGVGLELGVVSPPLFAMMVVMAIVTTLATAPLLSFVESSRITEPKRQMVAL